MCRAVPALVTRIEGDVAWVDERGREQAVSLLGLTGVKLGDYVYCHAGLALERLSAAEAREILDVLLELDRLMQADPLPPGHV